MTDKEINKYFLKHDSCSGDGCLTCRDLTNKQAGIKEVVELIREFEKINPDRYSHIHIDKTLWNDKLKEWGIK